MWVEAILVLVIGGAWLWWDQRRPRDPDREPHQERSGMRWLLALLSAVVVLIVALALQGFGVDAAGWVALVALFAVIILRYRVL